MTAENTQATEDVFEKMANMPDPGNSSKLARAYWDSLLIRMRYLNSGLASTETAVYGHTFSSPISISSISHLGMFGYGESAMVEVAKAAAELNVLNFVGHGSFEEFDQICATGAKSIRIIKPFEDHDLVFQTIERCEKAGAFAVGMDIDHIYTGKGTYDNVDKIPLSSKTTADLKSFVEATKLPFIVKGVLSVEDAEAALEAGAAGIFVSHHHGLYNFITPPAMMLPEIVRAVHGRVPVFIDGNIESGYDAFKGLALGADFVSVGRPLLKPVKKEGKDGVATWLSNTNDQLKGVMSRSCCTKVDEIGLSCLIKRDHRF